MLAEWMLAPAPPACHLISASLADTAQNNPEGVLGAKRIQRLQLLIGNLVIKSFSGPEGPTFHRRRHPSFKTVFGACPLGQRVVASDRTLGR